MQNRIPDFRPYPGRGGRTIVAHSRYLGAYISRYLGAYIEAQLKPLSARRRRAIGRLIIDYGALQLVHPA